MRMTSVRTAAAVLALSTTLLAQRGFPQPRIPAGNPITASKVLLGKALFFEEQLSAPRTIACATCHGFDAGGSDGRSMDRDSIHPGRDGRLGTPDDIRGSKGVIRSNGNGEYGAVPHFGVGAQVTTRRSMTVINSAFGRNLFWDGRADDRFVDPNNGQTLLLGRDAALETQAGGPPVNDVEMSHFGERWSEVADRIAKAKPLALASNLPAALGNFVANRTYPDLFQIAFGTSAVTPARIAMAIATYERTLISDQSPFDDFNRGNRNALTQSQRRGLGIFNNRCAGCHDGGLMTDNQFHNTGVRPVIEDPGRQVVTGDPRDRGQFRTPTTRNVALRPPYFHNGQMRTLEDVVDFYNRGGDFNDNKDRRVRRLGLNQTQRTDLVNFLRALTDPRVAQQLPPFDQPTLYSQSNRRPTLVGAGTPGTGSIVPQILAIEPPLLGNPDLTLGIRRGLGGAAALLGIALDANPVGIPLGGANLHLNPGGIIVVPGGRLWGVGAGAGYQSMSFAVPATPSLSGATIGVQWLMSDTGIGNTFSATEAARLRVF